MNRLKSTHALSDGGKNIIKSFFENDITLNNIYTTHNIEIWGSKPDLVISYYKSLQKSSKPLSKYLKKLHVKTKQTEIITSYYVNYHRDEGKEINIRIIDTQGLCDTKRVLRDNKITKQFKSLFSELGGLYCILFTLKYNITRWENAIQYFYDRVQQIFGKDAINIFMLIYSFADG